MPLRFVSWLGAVVCLEALLALVSFLSSNALSTRVPAAAFIGLSLSLLVVALHDPQLHPRIWLELVFCAYAVVQSAYVWFQNLLPTVLWPIYSFALVAKLLLYGWVAELVRSGRLHTYEGRASGRL